MNKKMTKIITSLLGLALILGGSVASKDNQAFSNTSTDKNTIVNTMTIRDSSCSQTLFNKQINEINTFIPIIVLNDMYSRGYKITFISGDLRRYIIEKENIDSQITISGATLPGRNKIYINAGSSTMAITHETGHAFDDMDGANRSSDQAFIAIFNAEKQNLYGSTNYFASSEREYFAQSFSMYLKSPSTLQSKAPQTYNYLNNILGMYSNGQTTPTSSNVGIINVAYLNVRSTNSTKGKVITVLKKNTKVTILDYKNGWYKIQSPNGSTGWASSKYIKK